jgi:hypothetical protein
MSSSNINGDHIQSIDHNNDEFEFNFKEYYSREKTLELRNLHIP